MRIFLAGASGLLGSAVARAAARRGHRVIGVVGSFAGELAGVSKKIALDLAEEARVNDAVLDALPDAIVNCAAVSVPEACDTDPSRARALNVALPAALARIARQLSARLVHISSEQVFDGTRGTPYSARDPAAPINLYGRQKLESEEVVHAAAPGLAATIRAPLLMGDSATGRRSTHERLFGEWSAGRTPRLYLDEFRQVCTAQNLAEVVVELCERRALHGVFHWAGTDLLSRHEIGVRVRARFGLTEKQAPLAAITRADTPEAAPRRQPCLALDISPLAGSLTTRPQSLREQLEGLQVPPPYREWYSRA